MKVPETTALIIAEVADLAAHAIGFNKKFEISWLDKKNKKMIDNFLFGKDNPKKEECIGLNLRLFGMDGIALDPNFLMAPERELEEIVDLVVHEVVHFKIAGHGKKFDNLLAKTMKKVMA